MIAILAESPSDAEVIGVLLRRHYEIPKLQLRSKGYQGCGNLYRKAPKDVRQWQRDGVSRFVVCHDADRNPPAEIRSRLVRDIVIHAGLRPEQCCIVIPVQEVEAWIVADEEAVRRVIPSFAFNPVSNPEAIAAPKEWLVDRSRLSGAKPRFVPAAHNPRIAEHLRLETVSAKCPSFRAFLGFLHTHWPTADDTAVRR